MTLIVLSFLLFFFAVIAINYVVVPQIIKKEGGLVRARVDELAARLAKQLDRVEANQRGMSAGVAADGFTSDPPWSITLGRYHYADAGRLSDDAEPLEASSWQESGAAQALSPLPIPIVPESTAGFFNAVVKDIGERIGGRVWIVGTGGTLIGDAATPDDTPNISSLNDFTLPMATPLRRLLAQDGDDVRQTHFLTASGEHTLIVQPVPSTSWLLAIDISSRQLNLQKGLALRGTYPQSMLLMVATLTLTRHFSQRLASLRCAITACEQTPSSDLPVKATAVLEQLENQFQQFMEASCSIARGNRALMGLKTNDARRDENQVAILAEGASQVVQKMRGIHEAASRLTASCGAIMQLAARLEKLAVDSLPVSDPARESLILSVAESAHELAQQSGRAVRDIRLVIACALPAKGTDLRQLEQADEIIGVLRRSIEGVAALIGDLPGSGNDEQDIPEVLPQLARHGTVLIAESYKAIRALKVAVGKLLA